MRGNRSRDTKPELALRSAVHALGLRFRVADKPLPNLRRTADMVFKSSRVAVFLDGCYWHGCPQHYVPSRTSIDYWGAKISRNKERDAETNRLLTESGWRVIRVWEHESPTDAARRVYSLLKGVSI